MLTVDSGGEPGEILNAVSAGEHVHRQRFLNRLAAVQDFQPRQLLVALPQQPGGAVEHPAALGAAHGRPGLKTPPRARNGTIHVLGPGLLDPAKDLAGGGIQRFEAFAALRFDVASVDVKFLLRERAHPRRASGNSVKYVGHHLRKV